MRASRTRIWMIPLPHAACTGFMFAARGAITVCGKVKASQSKSILVMRALQIGMSALTGDSDCLLCTCALCPEAKESQEPAETFLGAESL